MKKFVLLLVLVATLWHKDAMAYGEDSFFGQGSMSETIEYKLYDSYAKSDAADVKAEATNVPLGSGIVFLGVLALAYGARKLKVSYQLSAVSSQQSAVSVQGSEF